MKITIMGTGAYSIGIALMLAKKENNYVTLWTENEAKLEEFNKTHKISSIFDVNLPDNVSVTNRWICSTSITTAHPHGLPESITTTTTTTARDRRYT